MFDKKKYHHNKEQVQYCRLIYHIYIIYGKKVPSQLCEAALPRRRNKKRIICSIFKARCYNFRIKQHVLQEFYNNFIAQWPEIYTVNECWMEKMTLPILQYTAKVLNNFNTILDSGSKIFVDKLNSHSLDKIKLELFVTHSWTLYCTYLAAELHKVIFSRWRFDVNDHYDDSMKTA